MIGVVLVAHGRLAVEMRLAVEHVLGHQACFEVLNIAADEDMASCQQRFCQCLQQCQRGKGVLVVADLFGGTPCNIALSHAQDGIVEILTGMNLPMLVKIIEERSRIQDISVLVSVAQQAGRMHIHRVADLMRERQQYA